MTFYGYANESWQLGKGIKVFGKEIPAILYPVWKNDKVVGVFNVIYYQEQYSGSYSEGNSKQLSYAIGKTSEKYPLKLLKTENGFYYSIGSDIYSMTGTPGEKVNDFQLLLEFYRIFFFANGHSVNVKETIEYVPIKSE